MKRIIIEIIYCIIILSQLFTAYVFAIKVINQFNFDNLCVFISSIAGLYFSIDFGSKFIDKWSDKNGNI